MARFTVTYLSALRATQIWVQAQHPPRKLNSQGSIFKAHAAHPSKIQRSQGRKRKPPRHFRSLSTTVSGVPLNARRQLFYGSTCSSSTRAGQRATCGPQTIHGPPGPLQAHPCGLQMTPNKAKTEWTARATRERMGWLPCSTQP